MLFEAFGVLFVGYFYVMGDPVLYEFFELRTYFFIVILIMVLRIELVDLILIAKVLSGMLDSIFIIELSKIIFLGREVEIDVSEEFIERFLSIAVFIMIIIDGIEQFFVLIIYQVDADAEAFIPVYEVHDRKYSMMLNTWG